MMQGFVSMYHDDRWRVSRLSSWAKQADPRLGHGGGAILFNISIFSAKLNKRWATG